MSGAVVALAGVGKRFGDTTAVAGLDVVLPAGSFTALLGFAGDTNPEEVERAAERAVWLDFGNTTNWFYDVAWDLGLIVLHGDNRSMSVLAASDTD